MLIFNNFSQLFRLLGRRATRPGFALIGMSMALGLSLVAGELFWDAYSFDHNWANSSKIFKFERTGETGADFTVQMGMPVRGEEVIKNLSTSIEEVTTVSLEEGSFNKQDNSVDLTGGAVDKSVFDVFSFSPLFGNLKNAISSPNGMIITVDMAKNIFGKTNATGLTIHGQIGSEEGTYIVRAVIPRFPHNSSFAGVEYLRTRTARESAKYVSGKTYLKLASGGDPQEISLAIQSAFEDKFPKPAFIKRFRYNIQPLQANSLQDIWSNLPDKGMEELFAASLFLSVIALVNFLAAGISTYQSRSGEFGIRYILGATRTQLVFQIVTELLVFLTLACFGALVISSFVEQYMAGIVGIKFLPQGTARIGLYFSGWFILALSVLLGGIYPIILITRTSRDNNLARTRNYQKGKGNPFRSFLVGTQVFVGTTLLYISIIVSQQGNHLMFGDAGFQSENLFYLNIHAVNDTGLTASSLADELRQFPDIQDVAIASSPPFFTSFSVKAFQHPVSQEADNLYINRVSPNYFDLLSIDLLAGRLPDPVSNVGLLQKAVLNVSVLKKYNLGVPNEALGKCLYPTLKQAGNAKETTIRDACIEIVAVVSDHRNDASPKPQKPLVYHVLEPSSGALIMKPKTRSSAFGLDSLGQRLKTKFRIEDYSISSLDAIIRSAFKYTSSIAELIQYTTFASILLTGIGIFSLASYIVDEKRKEIAIRRIYGASSLNAMLLVYKQLMVPVFTGLILAQLLSWKIAGDWLAQYNDRIEQKLSGSFWVLLIVSILLALTVFGHFYRVTRIHFSEILRDN